jgi:hypothetical protein
MDYGGAGAVFPRKSPPAILSYGVGYGANNGFEREFTGNLIDF